MIVLVDLSIYKCISCC